MNICMNWIRRRPAFISTMLSILAAIMVLGSVEMYCRYELSRLEREVVNNPFTPEITDHDGLYLPDPLLWRVLPHDKICHPVKKRGAAIIYDYTCAMDSYARRITPQDNTEARASFLLCFGDSFTFGEGVNDDETFPSMLARYAPAYEAYNYGVSGYGPASALLKFNNMDVNKEISQKSGIFIYTFIDAHVSRSYGSMSAMTWGAGLPSVRFDDGDQIVYEGSWEKAHPWRIWTLQQIANLGYVRYNQLCFPLKNPESHYRFTARIIAKLREQFLEMFPESRFILVIYPQKEKHVPPFAMKVFEENGLETVNLHALCGKEVASAPDKGVFWDGHPTPESYRLCAETLTREIGISKQ